MTPDSPKNEEVPHRSASNPVIRGFAPDPSWCRVGSDIYLATSTFEWFPGCPIWHSRDLANWRLIGHALARPGQLALDGLPASSGVFAPTLRWRDGLFWLTTTIVDLRVPSFTNIVVTAEDPAGPWSDPVVMEGVERIDPSLFWDDDGSLWLCANGLPTTTGPDASNREIWLTELDRTTLQSKGERFALWQGALRGCSTPEAPHLFRKDGWYWLLIAEGGTGRNHAVTMARSRSLQGPYVGCPANPLLTHRHLGPRAPVQCTGHADFLQMEDGSWWCCLLGTRPVNGVAPLGRETFIVPMEWPTGEWPVLAPEKGMVTSFFEPPARSLPQCPRDNFEDDFTEPDLRLGWYFRRTPREWTPDLRSRPSWVRLPCRKDSPWTVGQPTMIARRLTGVRFVWQATVEPRFGPGTCGGLSIYLDEGNHLRCELRVDPSTGGLVASSVECHRGLDRASEGVRVLPGRLCLKLVCAGTHVVGWLAADGEPFRQVGLPMPLASCAPETSGTMCFTGAFAAVYACSESEDGTSWIDVDRASLELA